jgi:Dolichyl-phosphate-mannose-protein mannosyltransferase
VIPGLSAFPPASSRLVRAATGSAGAVAVVLALTVVITAWQPIGSPWWIYANLDASYTASGIDAVAGQHSVYLDGPGMPLVDVMAGTTEVRYIAHKLTNEHATPSAYASQRLLHLDDSRIFFRGFAILFFLAGVALAFALVWRLFGTPWWGAAGALLFLSAPGLQAAAIQFEPDVLFTGLTFAAGYLVVRAAERRDPWLYALAALLIGLTVTVMAQAAYLLLPLVVALVARPPLQSWIAEFVHDGRAWLTRYRRPLLCFFGVWVLLCVTFDRSRVPFSTTHDQARIMQELGLATVVYVASVAIVTATRPLRRFSRGPLRPVGLVLVGAFAAGVLLPGTLLLNDLPAMIVKIVHDLAQGGIQPGIGQSTLSASEFGHTPLLPSLIIVVLAGLAAGIGIGIGDSQPMLWFSGAAAMFVMATTHLGPPVTFAPAFVLSIPPTLWLARRLPRATAALAAVAVVAIVLVPTLQSLTSPRHSAQLQEESARTIAADSAKLLTKPNTIALMPDYVSPNADIRWFDFVQQVVAWTPAYPYRFLPDSAQGAQKGQSSHLTPAYYIGALPLRLSGEKTVTLGYGTFALKPLPQFANPALGTGVAKLVSGPGVQQH